MLATRQTLVRQGIRSTMPATQQALFLSFSRTAVSQIMDRAAGVIGRLGPRLEVATFHGFAWRIITGFGAHHGFPLPQTVLSSTNSRVPGAPPGLTYDELTPTASGLLAVPEDLNAIDTEAVAAAHRRDHHPVERLVPGLVRRGLVHLS